MSVRVLKTFENQYNSTKLNSNTVQRSNKGHLVASKKNKLSLISAYCSLLVPTQFFRQKYAFEIRSFALKCLTGGRSKFRNFRIYFLK